jgi:homoserine kinase
MLRELMQTPSRLEDLEIAVPASIGNVGPGFDTLGVAVRLYLRVRIRAVRPDLRGAFDFEFVGGAIDGPNLIDRALRHMTSSRGVDVPGLLVEVESAIPARAGLGSSAAATVAGLRLFEALAGPRPLGELLTEASRLEGHPDNAAAALHGGLVSSCQLAGGYVEACRWPWPDSIRFVIATPAVQLETAAARRVLPASVPRDHAVFNLQRVPLLLQALATGRHHLLREALRDEWHQPYRQPLVPGLEALLSIDHPDVLGVCLCGAGPSVAALAERNFDLVERRLSEIYQPIGLACTVRTLSVHHGGVS